LMWPKATPFCGGHFVPKQGLKKGVAEEAEASSLARHHGSRFAADPARKRRRGRRPRRQGTRRRTRRFAAFRMGRWRGTWLLSKFREQRGDIFMARGMTVCMADPGCACEEPEPLAHKLPTLSTTFALSSTLRSLCDSGGGGRRHRGSGERRSREDGKRVAVSRTFDIADHGAPGAGRARAQRGRSTARDRCGARGKQPP